MLAVVVAASPFRIVRNGAIHPGSRGELVVDEPALGSAEGRHAQSQHAVDQGGVQERLVGPVFAAIVDLAAVQVPTRAECVHVRLVRDVADGAGHRAGTEGRALRAIQDLDARDVIQVKVRLDPGEAQGNIIEKYPGGGGVGVIRIATIRNTTHEEQLGAGAYADEGN